MPARPCTCRPGRRDGARAVRVVRTVFSQIFSGILGTSPGDVLGAPADVPALRTMLNLSIGIGEFELSLGISLSSHVPCCDTSIDVLGCSEEISVVWFSLSAQLIIQLHKLTNEQMGRGNKGRSRRWARACCTMTNDLSTGKPKLSAAVSR